MAVLALTVVAAATGLIGATPNALPPPTVIVYPLTGVGSTPSTAGGNVALLLSTRLAELGGLNVKPATPGTARADFLTSALAQGADYYITGYLTPVGEDVSLIAQVVSTESGSVVYSTSATVRTYSDVLAQAENLRTAMIDHAQRGLPSVRDVQPAATPGPVASQGLNLSKVLGRHRSKSGPAPSPSPSASATAKPAATPVPPPTPAATSGATAARGSLGLVVDVDGNAGASELVRAGTSLASALNGHGIDGRLVPVQRAHVRAAALCSANPGSIALFVARLNVRGTALFLTTEALACNGAMLGSHTSSQSTANGGAPAAIDRATADAVSALLPAVEAAAARH